MFLRLALLSDWFDKQIGKRRATISRSAGKKADDFPLDSTGEYGVGWSNSRR